MKQSQKQPLIKLSYTIFSVFIALGVGFGIGINWNTLVKNYSPYLGLKTDNNLDFSSVNNLYTVLKDNYDGDIDTQKIIEGAKKGLIEAVGDKYTSYMTSDEANDYRASLNGDIENAGIGVSIAKRNNYVTVLRTLPNNPARKAGILAGDIIYAIDGKEVWSEDADSIAKKLQGKINTNLSLTVVREDKKIDFQLKREKINNVAADYTFKDDITILNIYRFSKDTGTEVKKLAKEIKEKNPKGLIVDLRNNGGGYVSAACEILGLWLDGDTALIQRSRIFGNSSMSATRSSTIFHDLKTIVLTNHGTASASEIMAGALKDHKKATIVGEKTYGKGVMQSLLDISGGSLLKVTSAHWYTPQGTSIDKAGIEPDITVERSYDQINANIDPQLDKALEELKK